MAAFARAAPDPQILFPDFTITTSFPENEIGLLHTVGIDTMNLLKRSVKNRKAHHESLTHLSCI